MRLTSTPPAPTCQLMHHGRPIRVCAAVAEAVRARHIGKDTAEAAQAVADGALALLEAVRRDASVNRWVGRMA